MRQVLIDDTDIKWTLHMSVSHMKSNLYDNSLEEYHVQEIDIWAVPVEQ